MIDNLLYGSLIFVVGIALGLVVDWRLDGPNGIKVDLAPNGMAYCPADSSTPHPTPCMFRQP